MGKTILLVDDESDILSLLSERLKKSNFQVYTAREGRAGLEELKKQKIELIILDIVMPVMDGFAMLKAVKQNPELSDIPIIISTARSMMKDTFYAMGVDFFLPKPYDTKELLDKINFLLSAKALLLSNVSYASDKVSSALHQSGFSVKCVETAESMLAEGRVIKYDMLIVHLDCIKQEPSDFLSTLSQLKNNNPRVIIYSDANVSGLEDGDIVKINDIKHAWYRAGAKVFYDSRIEALPLASVIKQVID
jgi:DNA-binding response OmpR family regulator